MHRRMPLLIVVLFAGWSIPLHAQRTSASYSAQSVARDSVPSPSALVGRPESELAPVVERFSTDLRSVQRRYDAVDSRAQRERLRAFHAAWSRRMREINFDKLSLEGRLDYVLLDRYLKHELDLLARRDSLLAEAGILLPFAERLLALQDERRDLVTIDARAAARTLAAAAREVDSLRALFERAPARRGDTATRVDSARAGNGSTPADTAAADTAQPLPAAPNVSRTVANRAAERIDAVRGVVTTWYKYYDGYDPLFTWWTRDPQRRLDEALKKYARTLREKVVGFKPGEGPGAGDPGGRGDDANANKGPIVGDPIGPAALAADLAYEMIPYTPEELIAIAEREYAFSLSEIRKAARAMGFGDDWKAAMEKVKDSYVEPGKQPDLIRDLARQAEAFFDRHDWVTIPPLAREDWRMEMMSPERQRVAPFFLGGETIQVSYPTTDMTDEEKLMSMRGNNPHFSHATVFHELNPGHHLQGFMVARYNSHRRLFSTPFWNEGQALYWEMFLWDHGFHESPEDRIGALFWRMHRSARIIFSLSFHLGRMTPEEAVQFLVDTVNFERANAEGEVRRSFSGAYMPLYQIAYMIGGLQLRALHRELVGSGRMTNRAFHDAVLQGGPMPIAMVRARLARQRFGRDGPAPWRFAETLPAAVPAR